MKVFVLLFFALLAAQCLIAQQYRAFDITASAGRIYYSSIQKDVYTDYSGTFSLQANYRPVVGTGFFLSTGLGFRTANFHTSGYFFKDPGTGQINFGNLPASIQQNRLRFSSIEIPLLMNAFIFQKAGKGGVALGVGPSFQYLLSTNRFYYTNGFAGRSKIPLDNKFLIAYQFEASTVPQNKQGLVFSLGTINQLTSFLNNKESFKSNHLYFKIGISF